MLDEVHGTATDDTNELSLFSFSTRMGLPQRAINPDFAFTPSTFEACGSRNEKQFGTTAVFTPKFLGELISALTLCIARVRFA